MQAPSPLHPLLNVHDISDVEVGIKWRPDSSELRELGPEFKEVWDSHFANAPDKPVLWTGILSRWVNRFAVHRRDCDYDLCHQYQWRN